MVNEIVDIIFKEYNKGIEWKVIKQHVLDYINNHNVNLQIFNWLLENQNNSDSIFLLGYFNYLGIETSKNKGEAFKLFINASERNHTLAQWFVGDCYLYGNGITKNE